MKKISKFLLFFLTFALLCTLSACKKSPSQEFAYRTESFTLRLVGNRGGVDLSCDISCENGSLVRMVYLAPKSMEGLTVTPLDHQKIRVEKDGISTVFFRESGEFSELLNPVSHLLFTNEALRSVQKISTGYLLTLDSESHDSPITLTLGADGFPTAVSGENFSFRVSEISDFHSTSS